MYTHNSSSIPLQFCNDFVYIYYRIVAAKKPIRRCCAMIQYSAWLHEITIVIHTVNVSRMPECMISGPLCFEHHHLFVFNCFMSNLCPLLHKICNITFSLSVAVS